MTFALLLTAQLAAASPSASAAAMAAAPAKQPVPTAAATASAAPAFAGGCVETLPASATRPKLTESFPARGTSGYVAVLTVDIEHGRGENVLPHGLELQSAGDAAKALKTAGFVVPDQDGGAAARVTRGAETGDRVTTRLEFPLVTLPPEAGRHVLILPPLPVAIARASGDVETVCTSQHAIRVEDPTASTPDAKPVPNPPPLVQREEWTAMKKAVLYGSLGVLIGAIVGMFIYRWMKRPKPVPPPPPPRPPWEIALERLDEVRHAGLLEVQRYSEYFDRVSDSVRSYLGARFEFDGLESTSDEILAQLKRARIAYPDLPYEMIAVFLGDCDLVKFARATPTPEDCARSLSNGEAIVRATMPRSFAYGSPPHAPAPVNPEFPKDPPSASPPNDAPPSPPVPPDAPDDKGPIRA